MRHRKGLIWVQMVTVHWFLLWKGVIYCQHPGYSIRMNSDVTVQEGQCVTIPCKFTADNRTTFTNSIGMWRNSTGTYVAYSNKSQTKFTKPNFHVVGNPDNGDCTLTITDARKGDSGSYTFRFEESETSRNKYFYLPAVTVNVTDVIYGQHPGYSIRMNSVVTVQEGQCVTIPCKFTADYRTTFTNSIGMWSNCAGIYVAYSNKSQTKFTKPNFHVVGNPDNGDCTLTITDARKEDSGSYRFRFEESEKSGKKYLFSPAVTVKVTDPPSLTVTTADPPSLTVTTAACRCMDNQIIIGIVSGNIFILLLFGLGVFCFIKKHVENKHRTESNDFQLHSAKGTESVYQDLNRPSDSTYHSIQSAKQLIHHK